jgi:serine kinase of HPr protein (carbohydrate metabolism regulator)
LDAETSLVHGTCIALDEGAAVLQGPSGIGKSDLALRCITQPAHVNGRALTARLVADDQVVLERRGSSVWARPPATIAGKLEVRGIGIIGVPHAPEARLRLVIRLAGAHAVERLPERAETSVLGLALPLVQIAPFEGSAPLKVLLALLQASR